MVFLYVIYPALEYYFSKNLITFCPYIIPGIDPQTLSGYIITMIFQIYGIWLAYLAFMATDTYFCMIVINVPMMPQLIEIEVNQLNDVLNDSEPSAGAIKFKLKNIILMYKEMKE